MNQTAFSRGVPGGRIFPFLWLHGEDEATLRLYMKVIHDANLDAVCVESRPHPDFLGPRWWHDLNIILEEARNRRMKVWILDDSHFPTGYAAGAVEQAAPELCRQSLVYKVLGEAQPGTPLPLTRADWETFPAWTPNLMEQYTLHPETMRRFDDDRLVGVAAVQLDGPGQMDLTGQLQDGSLTFTVPSGRWRVYALRLTRNRGPHRNYINMMCRASCKILLDTVYEAHWKHYAADFGRTIAGFFSDEPEIGNGHLYESGKRFWEVEDQAWSGEIESELRAEWGEHFVCNLPLLWERQHDPRAAARVRLAYMNAVTRAVQRDFSRQIGSWCHEHGVEYIGHLIEDNNQHLRCGSSLGHYFRGLSGQDMAGIDCIGGQVLPQGEWNGPYGLMGEYRSGLFYHYVLGHLGSSLAAIDPRKQGRCLCEIFGNYGWEEGCRLEKYLTDHFLVRGVNRFVPHAFSPKAYPDSDCPPHFYAGGHNPQYRHFGALMRYLNRMTALLEGGHRVAPVAILYNAEGDWTGDVMALETVAQPLADAQIDYDFIPLDVFTERQHYQTRLEDGLRVNTQTYRVLLIPGCDWLPETLAAVLPELAAAGCRVLFVGHRPACIDPAGEPAFAAVPVVDTADLASALDGLRTVRLEPAGDRMRCMRYQAENERYLLINEGNQPYTGRVWMPSQGPCYARNAWEGRLETITATPADGGTALDVMLYPGHSLVVEFGTPAEPPQPPLCTAGRGQELTQWKRSTCRAIDYPAFGPARPITLPDPLDREEPDFSGFVRYERTITSTGEKTVLEITDAYEGVEVFVNGQSLGIQIVPPFRYNLTHYLHQGENQLAIDVATTLERENAGQPDMIRTYLGLGPKQPTCPSGINGSVKLWIQ